MWLFFLFVGVPIIEIALFIQVGSAIGLLPTLGIVVATAFAGTFLMRTQGSLALRDVQNALSQGRDPSSSLVSGAMILVAGVLLLTPGFFTDALGLSLLFPPTRAILIRWGAKVVASRTVSFSQSGFGPQSQTRPTDTQTNSTLDGDYTVVDDK
jgi:UPF0716 protein FxsA